MSGGATLLPLPFAGPEETLSEEELKKLREQRKAKSEAVKRSSMMPEMEPGIEQLHSEQEMKPKASAKPLEKLSSLYNKKDEEEEEKRKVVPPSPIIGSY